MAKLLRTPVRGSTTGRPIMVLLDVLGQRWSLRILWELRAGNVTFRQLRELCDDVSPTLLNKRLKEFRQLKFVELDEAGFGLTGHGKELVTHFSKLDKWAGNWSQELERD
ncbi:winged helix-turn-helix transcriptional regulator [Sneathiella marina]|uniref:Winged helix-turn-helix transcriptional regulator n=1 Tax=Sneathiella marina TaxID=2950108 RepID=A0ABY4W7J7_9PROT|nr:winged helix-turn-helix transcriptional regulator [Sneathiella marina]USG62874.1 winged helix-turn-helix transcriptional regulator [Sneathiella marina]